MKQFITVVIFSIPTLIMGQEYLLEFDRFNAVYNFDWRGLEATDEYEVKRVFVEFVESNELLSSERRMLEMMEKKLRFSIKAVDLNNDQQTDIIYQGPHGGEGSLIHIFIQSNATFEKVFTVRQGIVKVSWKGELLDRLYICDWGCCDDPTLTNSVYQVSYSDNRLHFQLIWESVELEEFLTKPKTYFDKPKRFEILNVEYKLRANPFIDNTTENHHLKITGNTIGILKKGFQGTAYASSEDETGRTWWYVLVDRKYELKDAYINYPYHEFKPYLIGWISSRYVKELK